MWPFSWTSFESVLNVHATFAPRRSVDLGYSIEVAQVGNLCFCRVGHGPLPADDHAVLNGNGGKGSGWAGKTKREKERQGTTQELNACSGERLLGYEPHFNPFTRLSR